MHPKISFIIPVYNAEKYLHRCIKSIQKQSYSDFEIICVNDGSTDNSLNVLKQIQKTENRMKIIDQKNGAMDSRKRGVIESVGEYIWFVDDDDEIYNTNACERLIRIFEKEKDVQIIQFAIYSIKYSFLKTTREVKLSGKHLSEELIHSHYRDFLCSCDKDIITPTVWDKIYDAKVVKEACQRLMDDPVGAGDLYLNLHIITSNKFHNIYCTNEVYYKYYSGIGSYSKANSRFLISYSNVKRYQEAICEEYGLPLSAKYCCHQESVHYLYADIIRGYFNNLSDEFLTNEIEEALEYECIRRANAFFRSLPKKMLYLELLVLTKATPEEYLEFVKTHAKKPPNLFERGLKKVFK